MMKCQNLLCGFSKFTSNTSSSAFIFMITVLLSACGEAVTTADQAGDLGAKEESVEVALFPVKYFEPGYIEDYVITGVDNNNRKYSGTFQVSTGDEDVFNGVFAVPVSSTLIYSTIINGIQVTPITITLTEYFSSSMPRQYLGSVNSNTSLILTVQDSAVDIPESVAADASGSMAGLIGSNASVELISWLVLNNEDGTFDIGYTYNNTDSAGDLIDLEVRTFTVDVSGERLSWSLVAELPYLNNTLSFSGTRL